MSQITDNIENSSNDENENSDKNTNPITSITIFEDLEYYMPDDLAKTLDSHGYTPCHFQGIFPLSYRNNSQWYLHLQCQQV